MLQLLFYAKIIDRSEFIFSHFEIIKYFKILYIIFIFILFILSFIPQSCIAIYDLLLDGVNGEMFLNIKNPLWVRVFKQSCINQLNAFY